ncbi:hypothetical protein [Pelosinus sp. IPA-1]|uniref:hypothetical protein n=1 Tax=Pelosinus sp. IPA-1 TaxID=3029569 RepID=UPI002436205C|nr:hypothetical protein [Pelosinus sp. IPA-1]GMB00519.1 hypothetical protein PIPA1_33180 [Pelosinus sp. IPA-1]
MSLEDSVMASAMVVVLVSGMDLVISSEMTSNLTTIMFSSMDLVKVSGIIIGAKLLTKYQE